MSKRFTPKERFQISCNDISITLDFFEAKQYSTLRSALVELLRESLRECYRLLANINNLTLASLSIRNLFELYLIFKHVHSNEKALLNWYGQLHKDSKEIRSGFIAVAKAKGQDTQELEIIQEFEDNNLKESPFESKGSFQVRNLAEQYGYLNDYQFIYKLSSKLVHPSAMKVMAYDTLTENANYLQVVLGVGVYFMEEFSKEMQNAVQDDI